jgi:TetR/AcrR family transcriptional regulator, transcriptional repressor of aconitase
VPENAGGRRGSYAKGIRRRQEILDRALEVVAEKGFEATSLRAIGEAIDVSHAALRHYFRSREELLLEVLTARHGITDAWATREPFTPLVEQLTDLARRNVSVPGLIALYTSLLARSVEEGNETSRTYFTERSDLARRMISERIRTGQRRGEIPEDLPPAETASLIMAAFDGLQTQWLLDPSTDIAASLSLIGRLFGDRPQTPGGI